LPAEKAIAHWPHAQWLLAARAMNISIRREKICQQKKQLLIGPTPSGCSPQGQWIFP